MGDLDKSIQQKCFHNRSGLCHFLESDLEPCCGLCANFKSLDIDLRNVVNRRLRGVDKLRKTEPVDRYHLNLAFGFYPTDETVQKSIEEEVIVNKNIENEGWF